MKEPPQYMKKQYTQMILKHGLKRGEKYQKARERLLKEINTMKGLIL